MGEFTLPCIGFVRFACGDYVFVLFGAALILFAGFRLTIAPLSALSVHLALTSALCGVFIALISIAYGRRRIIRDKRPNPVALVEAASNHALAEGIRVPPDR